MVTSIALGDPALFRQQCYVNGGWMDAQGGDVIEVDNPATREIVGTVPAFGREETRAAIEAADAAWSGWRSRPAKERAGLLRRWFELLMAYQDDLAVLMTTEQGKPLAESRGEIAYAASFVEWFAEEAKRVYGDVIDHPLPGRRIVVLKQPIGVVASITPWNFPAAMITRKCAPALAAGCPVVIRPASQTPFSALALAELADRAGMPPGVVNVITGPSRPMGAELTSNPTVRKLSFTGSTEVGKLLMSQCASTVKKVSLELGGNAPFIVFDDADLDAAVAGAMASKYRNAGQTCVCANRVLVQDRVYDAFAAKMAAAVADHLERGGAVRRRQGVGHRPRGIEVRHGRLRRDQVPVPGRHRRLMRGPGVRTVGRRAALLQVAGSGRRRMRGWVVIRTNPSITTQAKPTPSVPARHPSHHRLAGPCMGESSSSVSVVRIGHAS